MTAAAILLQNGIEPILQLTCRDRNRIALQSELMGAAALGMRNLLVLAATIPRQGDQPDAKPVFDLDTAALTADRGRDARHAANCRRGTKVGGKAEFFIGAADAPIDPPAGWKPKSLKAKIAAGCAVRADPVLHGCRRGAALHGAARRGRRRQLISMLIGVSPLRSAKSARWIKDKLFGSIIPDAIIERLEARPIRSPRAGDLLD